MNTISKAVQEIRFVVPNQVLKLAYMGRFNFHESNQRTAPITLDEQIRRKTIEARVMVDSDIIGGETIVIDLVGLVPEQLDEFNYIFRIPPERLNYRTILTALTVNYMTYNTVNNNYLPGTSAMTPNYINDVSSAAHRAFDSRGNIPIVSSAEVLAVGHNTIMVRKHLIASSVVQARVVVTNDQNLMNISIRNAPTFSKLCKLAAKSFIYNELIVEMDKNYLERGQELGAIKTIVDGYSDAEEMYQTCLREEWAAVSLINNRLSYEDVLKLAINPAL